MKINPKELFDNPNIPNNKIAIGGVGIISCLVFIPFIIMILVAIAKGVI